MKGNYMRTNWIDNTTPVNANNLNNIERGISNLYQNALSRSDISEGEGIKLGTGKNGELEISTKDTVRSSSCVGIEFIEEELGVYVDGVLYLLLDSETNKLKKIILNGIVIYEVE